VTKGLTAFTIKTDFDQSMGLPPVTSVFITDSSIILVKRRHFGETYRMIMLPLKIFQFRTAFLMSISLFDSYNVMLLEGHKI
jgi:hypothetical protein